MGYWLLKTEPSTFGIEDLEAAPRQTTCWDGVRNYQARNLMRDRMRKGDLALFYHSSCQPPGIVGIVEIVRAAYPDHTALDSSDPHYDPASTADAPRWYMVDVKLRRRLGSMLTLDGLKKHSEGKLKGFQLLRRGNRLSVMPVEERHWNFILELARDVPKQE